MQLLNWRATVLHVIVLPAAPDGWWTAPANIIGVALVGLSSSAGGGIISHQLCSLLASARDWPGGRSAEGAEGTCEATARMIAAEGRRSDALVGRYLVLTHPGGPGR